MRRLLEVVPLKSWILNLKLRVDRHLILDQVVKAMMEAQAVRLRERYHMSLWQRSEYIQVHSHMWVEWSHDGAHFIIPV